LRELFVEAPYLAAERVVETALVEKVDFVVLCGALLDARRSGPVGPAFVLKQFERLHERGIAVYWQLSSVDAHWPRSVLLPPNVHRFGGPSFSHLTHFRRDMPLVEICVGGPADVFGSWVARAADEGRFVVALARGAAESAALKALPVRYWALGGRSRRQTLFAGRSMAHYAGTPQGRSPSETGARGCTLVEVDDESDIRTRFVATDVLGWCSEQLDLEPQHGPGDLDRMLHQRMLGLAERAGDTDVVIHWRVNLAGRLPNATWRHRCAELLEKLRAEHGFATPIRWSAALALHAADQVIPEHLRSEDTILGDFLSEVFRYQTQPERCLELAGFVSERQMSQLRPALELVDPKIRDRVLEEVAALGEDLLRGDYEGGEARS
jgi:hypothetical protein